MKHLRLAALLGAVTFLGIAPVTWAQVVESAAPAPTEKAPAKTRFIKIKNAPPSLMAYWLDPIHNPRPVALGETNLNQFGGPHKAGDKGAFALPGSIEQIVAVDAQSVILVVGGDADDISRLQELIGVLDQPLRRIELEAQFVELASADLKEFGIDASGPQENAPQIGYGLVRNNFSARLNALIAAGKAKIIAAPRVTETNVLAATIISSEKEIIDGELATVTNDYRITPTFGGDDTIAVSFKITENEYNENTPLTVINLRAGETAVLLGVLSAQYLQAKTANHKTIVVFSAESLRPTAPDRVVAVFLTPGIIRGAGEMPKK